jgi:hypothetical protein
MAAHQGRCVGCGTPTDSGLALHSPDGDWLATTLVLLCVALDRAEWLVETLVPQLEGFTLQVRACASCAGGLGFPLGTFASGRLPLVAQGPVS